MDVWNKNSKEARKHLIRHIREGQGEAKGVRGGSPSGQVADMKDLSDLAIFNQKKKKTKMKISSSTEQQVAVKNGQKAEAETMAALCACRSVCELRAKEPQRWERPRQPPLSHRLEGSAFLRRFFYRQEDSEKKRKRQEMEQMKRNGCQARRCFCVRTQRAAAGASSVSSLQTEGAINEMCV